MYLPSENTSKFVWIRILIKVTDYWNEMLRRWNLALDYLLSGRIVAELYHIFRHPINYKLYC